MTGPTFDEPAHLLGGQSYWERGDFRLQPENGNLSQRLVALPFVLRGTPFPDDPEAWESAHVWVFQLRFFEARTPAEVQRDLFTARLVPVALSALLCVLAFGAARRAFGDTAALLTLLLCATSPNVLAHGTLTTSDMPLTLALFGETLLLWWVLHDLRARSVALSALGLGLLIATKHSFVLIFPIAAALVLVRLASPAPFARRTGARRLLPLALVVAVHAVVSWVVVWAFYGFRFSAFAGAGRFYEPWDKILAGSGLVGAVAGALRDAQLLPEALLYGVAVVAYRLERFGYLAGTTTDDGNVLFYPVAFLLKTPAPLVALLLVGVVGLVMRADGQRAQTAELARRLYPLAPHVTLVVVVVGFAMGSAANMGLRHILPAYPALFVLAGAAVLAAERARAMRFVVATLAVGFTLLSLANHPRHLAYFNPPVGRDHAWRWLVDSSLDWGQALPELVRWLDDNPTEERQYLAFFGAALPERYGVRATRLPGLYIPPDFSIERLEPGRYIISATSLAGVTDPTAPLPWRPVHEEKWRALRARMDPILAGEVPAEQVYASLEDPEFRRAWRAFERLRFRRLAAALHARGPDHVIGGAILVFDVDAAELARALRGPPP